MDFKQKMAERYKTNEVMIFTALEAIRDYSDRWIVEGKSIIDIRNDVHSMFRDVVANFEEKVANGTADPEHELALEELKSERKEGLIELEIFTLAWGRLACPRVKLNQDQAAQFIISSISPDKAETLKAPWDAFTVEFPRNLITIKNDKAPNGIDTIERAMVMQWEEEVGTRFQIFLETVNYRQGFVYGTMKEIIRNSNSLDEAGAAFAGHISQAEQDSMTVAINAATRIALCAIVELQSPENFAHTKPLHVVSWKKPEMRKRHPKPVFSNLYTFGSAVNVHCYRAAKEYIAGNGASPMVRHLVRGFYRNQPWGPGSALRRWIYVNPFWRCTDKELTNVKPHKL
jgi:hypothetical protein